MLPHPRRQLNPPRCSSIPKLPQLTRVHSPSWQYNVSASTLSLYLNQVKQSLQCLNAKCSVLHERKLQNLQETKRVYQQTTRKQKKKNSHPETLNLITQTNEDSVYGKEDDNTARKVVVSEIVTLWKPPHRYKTAMAMSQNCMLLYGGLGCEKDIGWAKMSLCPPSWQVADNSSRDLEAYEPLLPIYGHTMGCHRSKAYIYGGICYDSVMNDLIILNLKTMQMSPGSRAPHRRKDHAMTMLNKFMLIHGGLQNGQESRNQLFFYDSDTDRWSILDEVADLPYRSHHGMLAVPCEKIHRRKVATFGQFLQENIYLFGGKDQKGKATNSLFCIKIKENYEVSLEEILSHGAPSARYSAVFQYLDSGYLLVYGGRSHIESDQVNQRCGIFNDLFLFSIKRKEWSVPELASKLDYRYGMASASADGKIYIFGGCGTNSYANADFVKFTLSDRKQIGEAAVTFDENCIMNSTKIGKVSRDTRNKVDTIKLF